MSMEIAMSDRVTIDFTKHAVKILRGLADDIESGVAKVKLGENIIETANLPEQMIRVVFDKEVKPPTK